MAINQFLKVQWFENKPYFKLYDRAKNRTELKSALGNIQMKKLSSKFCTGYYSLQEMTEYPCRQFIDLTNSKYNRCKNCEDLTGFSLCMMCKGFSCSATDKNALEFCRKDHLLYLAYFPNNNIKIGTTVYERRYERLLEQGAIFSYFIAKTNGMDIRKIETTIAQLGVTPQVTQMYKIKNLLGYIDVEETKAILQEKLLFIKSKLNDNLLKYFIEPEFNDFGKLLTNLDIIPKPIIQYDLFGEPMKSNIVNSPYEILEKVDSIYGNIITIIGSIAVLNLNNKFYALNLKEFFGWLVDIELDEIS